MLSMEFCRENLCHIVIIVSSYNSCKWWSVDEENGLEDGYESLISGGRIQDVKFAFLVWKK